MAEQTLCDWCEQPIEKPYDRREAVKLDNHPRGVFSVWAEGPFVSLHLHLGCWEQCREVFHGEHRRASRDWLLFGRQIRRSWWGLVLRRRDVGS